MRPLIPKRRSIPERIAEAITHINRGVRSLSDALHELRNAETVAADEEAQRAEEAEKAESEEEST